MCSLSMVEKMTNTSKTKKSRVVITGIGMITPLGKNSNDTRNAVTQGAIGISEITRVPTTDFDVGFAAEIPEHFLDDGIAKEKAQNLTPSSQIFSKTLKGKLTHQSFQRHGFNPDGQR